MIKLKRTARERKYNKQNISTLNRQEILGQKRTLENGAKDKLCQLSNFTSQFVTINAKKTDLAQLCPWNEENQENFRIKIQSRGHKRSKKGSESSILHTDPSSSLKRRLSSTDVKPMIKEPLKKSMITQVLQQHKKCLTQAQQRLSHLINSKTNRASNLFPQTIIKQPERSLHYTALKNVRQSLPINYCNNNRSQSRKKIPSCDQNQSNINKIVLKCKQSTIYFRIPPKEFDREMVKYIGEHAVFVKCRERSKYR